MKYCEHSAQHKWHHSVFSSYDGRHWCYLHEARPHRCGSVPQAGCKTHLPPGLGIKPSSNPTVFDTQPCLYNQHPHSSPALSFCPTTSFERWRSISIGRCCWSILNKQSDPLTTTSQKTTEKRALWLLPHFFPLGDFTNNIGEILTPLKSVAKFPLNLTGPEFYNFRSWLKFLFC